MLPTRHSACSVDKTTLKIHGEVNIQLNFGPTPLPITALVVDTIDCEILPGIPFCKENNIQALLKNEMITIGISKIAYGSKPPKPPKKFSEQNRLFSVVIKAMSSYQENIWILAVTH